jgi:hypothetical protein
MTKLFGIGAGVVNCGFKGAPIVTRFAIHPCQHAPAAGRLSASGSRRQTLPTCSAIRSFTTQSRTSFGSASPTILQLSSSPESKACGSSVTSSTSHRRTFASGWSCGWFGRWPTMAFRFRVLLRLCLPSRRGFLGLRKPDASIAALVRQGAFGAALESPIGLEYSLIAAIDASLLAVRVRAA